MWHDSLHPTSRFPYDKFFETDEMITLDGLGLIIIIHMACREAGIRHIRAGGFGAECAGVAPTLPYLRTYLVASDDEYEVNGILSWILKTLKRLAYRRSAIGLQDELQKVWGAFYTRPSPNVRFDIRRKVF